MIQTLNRKPNTYVFLHLDGAYQTLFDYVSTWRNLLWNDCFFKESLFIDKGMSRSYTFEQQYGGVKGSHYILTRNTSNWISMLLIIHGT